MTEQKHPSAWWVTFAIGPRACIEADTEAAAIAALEKETGK